MPNGKNFRATARTRTRGERGAALVTAITVLTVISSLVLAYLSVAADSSRSTAQKTELDRLETAAESAVALAVNQVWGEFETIFPEGLASHWDFRVFLDTKGIANQANAATPVRTDLLPTLGLPLAAGGERVFDGVEIESLDLWRSDGFSRVSLFVEVTVHSIARNNAGGGGGRGALRRTIQEAYVVEPPSWGGLDYALLANNINCVMCHTEVDNVRRFYNMDPANFGAYDRVKVGSLESLQLREDPHSWIAGTLYLDGLAVKGDGSEIAAWGALNFKSREFDGAGRLLQDAWGDLAPTNLVPENPGSPAANGNLYVDYAGSFGGVDGYLPSTFPPPFPDDGGFDAAGNAIPTNADNRVLDDSEFTAAVRDADGSISGGLIHLVDPSSTVTTAGELDAFMNTATHASLDSITAGQVHLYGTIDNPILLNGEVAIDGDVVIHGYVKGAGTLKVSGNVYMPNDLVYLDGTDGFGARTFGVAGDGTPNLIAIASGGNQMVGDIFHPTFGEGEVTGSTDGDYNFILEELGLFNRMEWIKSQPTLPGKAVKVLVDSQIVSVEKWNWEKVFWNEDVPIYEKELVTWEEEVPIYAPPDPTLPPEYEQPAVIIGYETVEKSKWVSTGNIIGYDTVEKSKWEKVGESWFEDEVDETWEWQTPQHPNPHFEGAGFIPRYYAFSEGAEVPIYNKKGYFDPATSLWMAGERVGEWDTSYLTLADPNDANDPILFDGAGTPRAVISTLTATGGWMSSDLLRELLRAYAALRDETQPLEIDGTFYSNNSIFGIIPGRNAPGFDGKMLLNGSIVASDIGLLAPERFQLNHDGRGKNILDIPADNQITIRRGLRAPAH